MATGEPAERCVVPQASSRADVKGHRKNDRDPILPVFGSTAVFLLRNGIGSHRSAKKEICSSPAPIPKRVMSSSGVR